MLSEVLRSKMCAMPWFVQGRDALGTHASDGRRPLLAMWDGMPCVFSGGADGSERIASREKVSLAFADESGSWSGMLRLVSIQWAVDMWATTATRMAQKGSHPGVRTCHPAVSADVM